MILSMDARLKYLSILRPSICTVAGTSPQKEQIRRSIVNWILYREYWDQNDSLDAFSDRTGIPREEITSFLFNHTGHRYLSIRRELRICDAKTMMLERPELPINEVARMVGISDKSNFRKDFTETVGYKPTLWKECKGKRWRCFINSLEKDRNHSPSPRTSS